MLTKERRKKGAWKKFWSRPVYSPPAYANDNRALVPEIWAAESIRILFEKMQWASVVHRDFDKEVATFGETVHTRIPQEMRAKRKQNDLDSLEDNDAKATGIDVKLNQRAYVTFLIGDGEKSKSFKDLFEFHMVPQMEAQARLLDRCVGGQVYQFLSNRAGGLGLISSTTVSDYMLDFRGMFNDNKVSEDNRWLGWTSASETAAQKVDLFKSAERVGDGGEALRRALLGMKHGFNNFLSLNTPSVRGATLATATTSASAAAAGDSTINITAAVATGTYLTAVGDMTPQRVLTSAGAGAAHTFTRPFLRAVGNGAVVQPYATGFINQAVAVSAGDNYASQASGYPAGWMKSIVVDGTGVPKLGQLVAFKAAGGTVHTAEYCIVDVISATEFLLDRPLVDSLLDNDIVCYGPNGDYNFGLQRNAVALVNRPLALPEAGTGVRSATAEYNNMAIRVTMTYDGVKQAQRVTVDALFGVAKLEGARGGVLLG